MTSDRALSTGPDRTGSARLAVSVQFAAMGATMGSWAARIPSVRSRLTLDDAQWGLATLGSTVGSLLATVLIVVLAPRLGPRRLASASAALLLINAPLLAAARNPVPLVVGLLVQGLAASSLSTTMNAQAVEVQRLAGRRIMSTFHACFSLGQLTGGVISTVAARVGLAPSWQLAGTGIILAVLLVTTARSLPTDPPPRPRGQRRSMRERITPQLALLAVIVLLASINEGAANQWSAQYTAVALGAGAGLGAATFTCFSLAMTTSRVFGDRFVNRWGVRRFVTASELVVAIGFGSCLLIGRPWSALVGFALLGIGSACIVPTAMGVAGSQPGLLPAEGVSVVALGSWPAFLIGPPLIGLLAGVWGLPVALGLLVVTALGIVGLAQWIRVDTHPAVVVRR